MLKLITNRPSNIFNFIDTYSLAPFPLLIYTKSAQNKCKNLLRNFEISCYFASSRESKTYIKVKQPKLDDVKEVKPHIHSACCSLGPHCIAYQTQLLSFNSRLSTKLYDTPMGCRAFTPHQSVYCAGSILTTLPPSIHFICLYWWVGRVGARLRKIYTHTYTHLVTDICVVVLICV